MPMCLMVLVCCRINNSATALACDDVIVLAWIFQSQRGRKEDKLRIPGVQMQMRERVLEVYESGSISRL